MMNTLTAATTATTLHHVDAGLATAPLVEQAECKYAGNGHFLPANQAAHDECRRWNDYAERWNQRTARSLRQ